MQEVVKKFMVPAEASVKQAMRQMKDVGERQMYVVDGMQCLLGALSDGDIRRWILSEGSLQAPVIDVCCRKPMTVSERYRIDDVKSAMIANRYDSIPVVGENGLLVAVLTWDAVFRDEVSQEYDKVDIPVVIMAGGKGARLDPFTKILPKPLIPIGDKPIIEHIVERFARHGIDDFFVSVNHKARMIKSYFEEANPDWSISYIEEEKPLGTAGALKYMESSGHEKFIVTNCDILLDSDIAEIVRFHEEKKFDMTMVVSCRHYVIPYGVCRIQNGGLLDGIDEKPEHDLLVNIGVYVMNRSMCSLIPEGTFYNVDTLIRDAKARGMTVGVFPIQDRHWVDIGQWEEYHKALEKWSAAGI